MPPCSQSIPSSFLTIRVSLKTLVLVVRRGRLPPMAMREPEASGAGDDLVDLLDLLDVPIRGDESLTEEQRAAEEEALEEWRANPVGVDYAMVRALIMSLPDDE